VAKRVQVRERDSEPEVIIAVGTSTFNELAELNERSRPASAEVARVAPLPAAISDNPPAVPPVSAEKREEFKSNRVVAWITGGISIVVALVGLGSAALKVEPHPAPPPNPPAVVVIDCPSGEMGSIKNINGSTVVACQRQEQPR
jgi:hypothetical protein